ncbi:hypothetical protein [Natronorubrum halophilum]|nr:hypothetical protein [Natronorubrum halophilum]
MRPRLTEPDTPEIGVPVGEIDRLPVGLALRRRDRPRTAPPLES